MRSDFVVPDHEVFRNFTSNRRTLLTTEVDHMTMDTEQAPITDPDRKVPEAWHEDNDIRTDLKTLLRPMFIAMASVGGYNLENLQIYGNMTESSRKRWKRLFSIYRLAILSAILFYIGITIIGISQPDSIAHLVMSVYQLLCLILYILTWKASSVKYGTLNTALTTWDKTIMPQFRELNIKFPFKQIRKTRNIIIVLGITMTMVNVSSLTVQFVLHEDIGHYTYPLPSNGFAMALLSVCYTLCAAIWVLPNMYVAMIAYILKQAFIVTRTAMTNSLKAQSCKLPPNFQKLRILHMNLCTLVGEFDADFGWYYAALFVGHVGLACLNSFLILRTDADTFTTATFVFWAVTSLVIMGFASIFAAMVNQEAHAPLDTIYYINVTDVDLEKLAQINLFLSKLTGTQVGFSTCGLLIITKEFILSIAGVFLTYFAVLYTL